MISLNQAKVKGDLLVFLCILVPKPDGTYRMCIDYRKVNNLSKTDTFLIQEWMTIDKIGNSKYITKFDLLKGFWQFLSQKELKRSQHLLLLMDYITIK